jgi:hypothetical protein
MYVHSDIMRVDKKTKIREIDSACFVHHNCESIFCVATREIVLNFSIGTLKGNIILCRQYLRLLTKNRQTRYVIKLIIGKCRTPSVAT